MSFSEIISSVDNFLWGWPLIIMLFGTHIFMTIRTGFIQTVRSAHNGAVLHDRNR